MKSPLNLNSYKASKLWGATFVRDCRDDKKFQTFPTRTKRLIDGPHT